MPFVVGVENEVLAGAWEYACSTRALLSEWSELFMMRAAFAGTPSGYLVKLLVETVP